MIASTATADLNRKNPVKVSTLAQDQFGWRSTSQARGRRAWLQVRSQAGGLAPRGLDMLFQVCLGLSGLRAPVSPGVLAVSSRTVMNNVG